MLQIFIDLGLLPLSRGLQALSAASRLDGPVWLLFAGSEQPTDLEAFFSDTYVPVNCVFLVAQPQGGGFLLTEVYHVSQHHVLQADAFGMWNPKTGAQFTEKVLYERRRDLQGLVLRGTGIELFLTTLYQLRGYLASMRLVIARWYLARCGRGFAIDYLAFILRLGKPRKRPNQEPPLTVFKEDNGTLIASGFFGNLWNTLQRLLNFTTRLERAADNAYGSLDNGSWNGVIQMLQDKAVDVAVGEFRMTTERLDVIDYTRPISASRIMHTSTPNYLLLLFQLFLTTLRNRHQALLSIPHHRTSLYSSSYTVEIPRLWNSLPNDVRDCRTSSQFKIKLENFVSFNAFSRYNTYIRQPSVQKLIWSRFLSPFSPWLWVSVVICIFVFAGIFMAVFQLNRRFIDPGNAEHQDLFVWDSLHFVCGAFCQQGQDFTPRSNSCRMMYWSMYVVGVVLVSAYSAALVSFLAKRRVDLPFSTLEELAKDGTYKFGVLQKSAEYSFFYVSKASQELWEHFVDYPDLDNT
ncbi:hypothetical protein ANN_12310 [Periplaneta americana]|uniref:Ionotropic glutamate receptor L-glutamate and glycine-binding domain-containing protein n=1 Tax=Periplaneta americana TaxID=6978 RepID=A0ABQ8TH72_PERAM|nr:hypothetical protein ANN_12310 [Periplaneta americana]